MSNWRLIASKMEALKAVGDTELAHCMADDLLIEAIRYLSLCDDITRPDPADVEPFLANYRAIDKWYA